MQIKFEKIDKNGNYGHFPGVTVIAPIEREPNSLWKELFDCLNRDNLLTQYYTPLPFESYHVTTMTVCNERRDGGDNWQQYIRDKSLFFNGLFTTLSLNQNKTPMTIDSLTFTNTIMICVLLSEEQQHSIQTVAEQYGLEKKIPPFFHVSLAYQFKTPSPSIFEQLKNTFQAKFDDLIKLYGDEYVLKPAQLCSFEKLSEFTPWDGTGYPFEYRTDELSASGMDESTALEPKST